jgi:uncharacterized protein (DUF983 family)
LNRQRPPGPPLNAHVARVRARTMLRRALARHCPICGSRDISTSWFRLADTCPQCGLRFTRNEEYDYWTGGYLLNFIVAEMIVAIFMTAGILLAWPDVPWNAVLYITAAAAITGPLLTFPFAKTLWLAIDLVFRPPEPHDFVHRGEDPGHAPSTT